MRSVLLVNFALAGGGVTFPHPRMSNTTWPSTFPHPRMSNTTWPSPFFWGFIAAFFEGFTNDKEHVKWCMLDTIEAEVGFIKLVEDIVDHDKTSILKDLNDFIDELPTAMDACGLASQDVKVDLKIWKDANVTSLNDFAKLLRTNLDADTSDQILTDFELAWEGLDDEDWPGTRSGLNVGMAFHRLLLGPFPDENTTVV